MQPQTLPPSYRAVPPVRRPVRPALLPLALLAVVAPAGCEPEPSRAAETAVDVPSAASGSPVSTPSRPGSFDGIRIAAATPEEAGRYLAVAGGCNDCHTDGWMATDGNVPESAWLTGSAVGFRGPWGTSYPSNLRLSVQQRGVEEWIAMIRTRSALPPMPWMNVRQLPDDDLRSLYAYLRSLGPAGDPAPAALPPEVEPGTPWFDFVPRNLPVAPGS